MLAGSREAQPALNRAAGRRGHAEKEEGRFSTMWNRSCTIAAFVYACTEEMSAGHMSIARTFEKLLGIKPPLRVREAVLRMHEPHPRRRGESCYPLAPHCEAFVCQFSLNPWRPVSPPAALVNRSHTLRQSGV